MLLNLKEYWKNNPKKRKLMMFGAIATGMMASFGLYALAQSMLDSFTDSSRIGGTWNATVDTGAGEIKLANKTCDDGTWFCSANTTCPNGLGDGTYIIVKRANETTNRTWKLVNTACDKPTCAVDGGVDGDNLVADNTVIFSDYPAREACKAVGGRLPTKTELQCIYANRTTFGDNFGTALHWSSTENNTTNAWFVDFTDGTAYSGNKNGSKTFRCVRGW